MSPQHRTLNNKSLSRPLLLQPQPTSPSFKGTAFCLSGFRAYLSLELQDVSNRSLPNVFEGGDQHAAPLPDSPSPHFAMWAKYLLELKAVFAPQDPHCTERPGAKQVYVRLGLGVGGVGAGGVAAAQPTQASGGQCRTSARRCPRLT